MLHNSCILVLGLKFLSPFKYKYFQTVSKMVRINSSLGKCARQEWLSLASQRDLSKPVHCRFSKMIHLKLN